MREESKHKKLSPLLKEHLYTVIYLHLEFYSDVVKVFKVGNNNKTDTAHAAASLKHLKLNSSLKLVIHSKSLQQKHKL